MSSLEYILIIFFALATGAAMVEEKWGAALGWLIIGICVVLLVHWYLKHRKDGEIKNGLYRYFQHGTWHIARVFDNCINHVGPDEFGGRDVFKETLMTDAMLKRCSGRDEFLRSMDGGRKAEPPGC